MARPVDAKLPFLRRGLPFAKAHPQGFETEVVDQVDTRAKAMSEDQLDTGEFMTLIAKSANPPHVTKDGIVVGESHG